MAADPQRRRGGGGGGAPAAGPTAGGNGGSSGRAGARAPGAGGGAGGGPATSTGSGAGGAGGARSGSAGSAVDLVGGPGGPGDPGGGDGGGGGGYGFGGGGAGGAPGHPAVVVGDGGGGGGGGGGGSSYVDPRFLQPGVPVSRLPGTLTGDGSITVTYHAPLIQCGQAIYTDMTLTRDLDCPGSGPALVVGDPRFPSAGPLVLDLGGHTVRGTAAGTGIDFQVEVGTVRGGTLRGFGTGVSVHPLDEYGPASTDATVSHLRIYDGTFGVHGDGQTLGIGVAVDHSFITRMTSVGVFAVSGFIHGDLTVTDTTVTDSGDGVVGQLTNATLHRDVLTGNTYAGADLMADAVTATGNTMTGNRRGLLMFTPIHDFDAYPPPGLPGGAVTITGNTVSANTTSGILLQGRVAAGSVLSATGRRGTARPRPSTGRVGSVTASPSSSTRRIPRPPTCPPRTSPWPGTPPGPTPPGASTPPG